MSAERLPALGQPAGDEPPARDPDFSNEHDATAVDKDITADREPAGEPEGPHSWSGLDHEGAP